MKNITTRPSLSFRLLSSYAFVKNTATAVCSWGLLALISLSLLSSEASAQESKGTAVSPALKAKGSKVEKQLKFFACKKSRFQWTLKTIRKQKTYVKSALTFPSAMTTEFAVNNTVHGVYYRPRRAKGPVPGVVILHHLGGSMEAEEVLAAHLATHGVAAMTMKMPYYGKRKPKGFKKRMKMANEKDIKQFVRQAVLDTRRAADVLRSFKEVDGKRVNLAGVSLGAIVGSLTVGVDARFDKAVLILGGGKLEEIFFYIQAYSKDVQGFLKDKKYTKKTLSKMVKEVDPVTYAHRMRKEGVLMLNASNDELIPKSGTVALNKAFGKPEIHWYNSGHFTAALHIFNIMRRTLRHLKSKN